MSAHHRRITILAVLAAILVAAPVTLAALHAARCGSVTGCAQVGEAAGAATDPWARGFNFTTWTPDGYGSQSAATSFARLRATGADSVALIPTWYQARGDSTQIGPDPRKSPTDASLAVAVALARTSGLKVFLRPLVDAREHVSRTAFAPRSADAWFASYRRFIGHYADLAHRLGVDTLSVGAEFTSLDGPPYEPQWRAVIADVRRRFRGSLTYSANTHAAWDNVRFWDALDVIGIDAYFSLASGTASTATLVGKWRSSYVPPMGALAAQYHKQIVLTELGYPSTTTALSTPWQSSGPYSATEQQQAFEAAFQALTPTPWFGGAFVWDWSVNPGAGGPGQTDYTPARKPAQRTIEHWFGGPTGPISPGRVRLTRVSLHRGRLTLGGTVRGPHPANLRVAYCGSGSPVVLLLRDTRVTGARFVAQFALAGSERSIKRVRAATVVVGAPGRGRAAIGATGFTLKGAAVS